MATILDLLVLAALLVGALWLRSYLTTYLGEKGKNLATKEDIGALTHQVEAVKLQYQRAGVVHQAQFEAEFRIYQEIWEHLVDVQRTAMELRPMVDRGLAEGETAEQRKAERLQGFAQAFNGFTRTYWKRRPFYPDDVFRELNELTTLVRGEAIDYELMEPQLDRGYWHQARDGFKTLVRRYFDRPDRTRASCRRS